MRFAHTTRQSHVGADSYTEEDAFWYMLWRNGSHSGSIVMQLQSTAVSILSEMKRIIILVFIYT